ncbi:MAG: transposase, partial [Bifidobacteriaceae bacterium]|nr:transposase [Bifidobacteriaceae bacterium]
EIDNGEQSLAQLAQLTKQEARRRANRFKIDLRPDGTFAWQRDLDKIDHAARDAGFFAILTNTDLASAQVLQVYRRRDQIEKGFDDLKNHIDMNRLRIHNDETTSGKMFCAFIALIAVSRIQAAAGPVLNKTKQSISKTGILAEMDKIKIVDAASGLRLINPATKLQRDILEAGGLTEEELKTYAGQP